MEGQPSRSLDTTMKQELENLIPMSPLRCIYRVPKRLRRIREEAYTPWIISIGPLHHGNKALIAMEEHKKRYLVYFLRRNNDFGLIDYIGKLKDQEEKIRSCYSETIELSSDDFVRIILLDAVFMVEFLFRYWYPDVVDPNDCIFGKPKMIEDIRRDLLMLENQIPFFILEDLFDPHMFPLPSSGWSSSNQLGFESLSIMFLSCLFLIRYASPIKGLENSVGKLLDSNDRVEHLLDLLRKLCTIPMSNATQGSSIAVSPTLRELHRAGVKFKAGSTSNLFEIQFKDGILEIPQVIIHNSTELVLRNLVAFEQCLHASLYICDYVTIMDQFVDSPKDVEFLVEYGIVKSWLGGGSAQLCGMINGLSAGVNFNHTNFYYGTLCEDLQKFCGSKWHKRIANLKQNYFNTPWAIISFVAAVILLLFTATQTICSIISLLIKK